MTTNHKLLDALSIAMHDSDVEATGEGRGDDEYPRLVRVALERARVAGRRLVPVEPVEVSSKQCAAAIGVLVRHGLLPKHADTETYLRTYDAMKEALIAAQHGPVIEMQPARPLRPAEPAQRED